MAMKKRNRALPRPPHGCRRAPIHCRGRARDPLPLGLAQSIGAAFGVDIAAGAPLPRPTVDHIVGTLATPSVTRCALGLLTDPDSVRADIARSAGAALTFAALLEDIAEGIAEHAAAVRALEQVRAWITDEIARRADGARILAEGAAVRVVNSRGEALR
jgi:hypothetical protein